jgi:hypothetical protein
VEEEEEVVVEEAIEEEVVEHADITEDMLDFEILAKTMKDEGGEGGEEEREAMSSCTKNLQVTSTWHIWYRTVAFTSTVDTCSSRTVAFTATVCMAGSYMGMYGR